MTEKKSAKELTDLVDLLLGLVSVGLQAEQDGKIDFQDLALLMQIVPLFAPAFDGVKEIPAELADLSLEEGEILVAHVMATLVISDVHAKAVIEKALKTAVAVYDLVKALQAAPVASAAV